MIITEKLTLQSQEVYLKSAYLKEQNKFLNDKAYRDTIIKESIKNGYCLRNFLVPLTIKNEQKNIVCNFIYYVEYRVDALNRSKNKITIDYSTLCWRILNSKFKESPETASGFFDVDKNSVFIFIYLWLDLYEKYAEKNYISSIRLFKSDMLSEFESKYDTYLHEMVHAFDHNIKNDIDTFRRPYDWWFSGMPVEEADVIKNAYFILYRYWAISEFNAWNYTDDSDYSIESKLETIKECDNEETWEIIKNIANSNKDIHKRISKLSPLQFKNFFIEHSEFLIDKSKKRLQKNIYQKKQSEQEIKKLSKIIYNEMIDFINKNKPDRTNNFDLKLNFDLYFPNLNSIYGVTVSFNIIYKNLSKIEKWESNNYINITIPKIRYKESFDIFSFQYIKAFHPFYDMYKTLTGRVNKTKLEDISNFISNEFLQKIPQLV